jgi:voltage-gated potassium channel
MSWWGRGQEGRDEGWRARLHEIIFEADTPAGKTFDVGLLVLIGISLVAISLESIDSFAERHGPLLRQLEWIVTGLFTIEYVLRLLSVRSPIRYARSFFGVVDLLAVLPSYLSLFLPGAQELLVVRSLRLLRIFRVFKLAHFIDEAEVLLNALRASRAKITVFLGTVTSVVMIMGALMHLIEGPENGFTSIPRSMYWAVVTMTTVGYGDISPNTVLGQLLASMLMIMGYGVIAVPTGIVSAELVQAARGPVSTQACPNCSAEGHPFDAVYCKACGALL